MLTQQTAATLEADLAQFYGTDNWWRHWTGRITYTDGVKFLAEKAGAYRVCALRNSTASSA